MRVLMTEDSNNAQSDSFLLDDSSRWDCLYKECFQWCFDSILHPFSFGTWEGKYYLPS